ncbi:hypothetical protein M513_13478 [Trichuris suis]|uniref:Uncharacterized protein n=1 Tax=Trichuris suis TaxID=68888 RepID=A0A085LKZ7_9BILA|nr:hypothetical protein M513_13478 [Trichuris suis]
MEQTSAAPLLPSMPRTAVVHYKQESYAKSPTCPPIDFLLEYTLNQSSTPWKGTNFRNKKIPNSTQEPQRIEDRRLQSYHNGQTTEHSNRTERTL